MTTEELNTAAAAESLRAAIRSDDEDESQPTGGVGPSGGSLEGVMLLMKQLIESMPANIAAAVKVDKPNSHLDNAEGGHPQFPAH